MVEEMITFWSMIIIVYYKILAGALKLFTCFKNVCVYLFYAYFQLYMYSGARACVTLR